MNNKNNFDSDYCHLLEDILNNGFSKNTRAGEVISVFGRQIRINMRDGKFPLLTTKKMFYKGIIHELLWFISGNTNIKYLLDNNVHIWDDDAYRYYLEQSKYQKELFNKDDFLNYVQDNGEFLLNTQDKPDILKYYKAGDLGPVYGHQWRKQGSKKIDQLQNAITMLKSNPDDRRIIVNAWNAEDIPDMALPPCHIMFQFYTRPLSLKERCNLIPAYTNELIWQHENIDFDNLTENKIEEIQNSLSLFNIPERELSLMWTQRSVDAFLGLPFNCSSYALLLAMVAQCVNMTTGDVIGSLGDTHIYKQHLPAVKEQLSNDCYKYNLPVLRLNPQIKNIDDFKYQDIEILNYNSFNTIKAPLLTGLKQTTSNNATQKR